jgi:hypothetical protein
VSDDYPDWLDRPAAPPVEVDGIDYAALREGWEESSWRVRYLGETTAEWRERVLALIAAQLAPAEEAGAWARHLEVLARCERIARGE